LKKLWLQIARADIDFGVDDRLVRIIGFAAESFVC